MNYLAGPLATIFNSCLNIGYFPALWKMARVCVIKKQNRHNYYDVNSYRPISVTNCLSKILEKILLNRLKHLAESGNWISSNQHGFQIKKSTETALHTLVSEIEVRFEGKETTASAFIDIKSAFDTAWPPSHIAQFSRRMSE